MPLEKSEAIILRTFPVGEQDKIVVFFSRDKGIMRGIAKGARKFGNRFGSSLEPFSYVNIFYYEKERKELSIVSNCDLIESFFEIQKDLNISFTLAYFAEIVEEFFPARSKDEPLFRLLIANLQALKAGGDLNFLSAYFEAWFLKINGILPVFHWCKKCQKNITGPSWLSSKKDGVICNSCAEQKKEKVPKEFNLFLEWIKINPPPKETTLPLTSGQTIAIRKILQSIIVFHLERDPKALHYVRSYISSLSNRTISQKKPKGHSNTTT